MKKNLQLLSTIIGLVFLTATSSYAISPYIYASIGSQNPGGGGIGAMLTDEIAVDFSAYYNQDRTANATGKYLYADIFYGSWGIGYAYDATDAAIDPINTTYLLYAVSQPINDKIALGITTTLWESSTGGKEATQLLTDFDITLTVPLPF